MTNTYKITLYVDGRKTYTRNATITPKRDRYRWVAINACNPTRILHACNGKFATHITTACPACPLGRYGAYSPVVLPVTYINEREGVAYFYTSTEQGRGDAAATETPMKAANTWQYRIAFVNGETGCWDVVETFDAVNDKAANAYAESRYAGREWYVLNAAGDNIN